MVNKKNKNPVINKDEIRRFFSVDKKQQATAVLLLTFILTLFFVYIITLPIYNSYTRNLINFENLKNEKKSLENKREFLQRLVKDKEMRSSFLSKVEDVLPQEAQIPEILVTLEKLSSDNSLILTNVTPKEDTDAKKQPENTYYKKMILEFYITGNYPNMKQFIKDLENNIRPVHITSIGVLSEGVGLTDLEENIRFNIKSYIYYESTK
uniref:Type 4a pilus biogenesis protein PilO n=1 Tax=candidate division CPR3 bacterium TaxID=2268181 RepID=A0A7C4R2Q7_UNCC3